VIERPLLGAATGKANLDHCKSLKYQDVLRRAHRTHRPLPREPRILAELQEK
jgi:hypothetical protein